MVTSPATLLPATGATGGPTSPGTGGGGSVAASAPASAQVPTEGPVHARKLFIGGLSHDTDDRQLRQFYEKWGVVIDCIVIRDPATKQSRGFGFVTFSKASMADVCLAAQPHVINTKTVDPKKAIPREEMPGYEQETPFFHHRPGPHDELKLYIKGLAIERQSTPDYQLVDQIRSYFGGFGRVEQVETSVNPRRLPFVILDNPDAVKRCMHNSHQHKIANRHIQLIRATHFDDDVVRVCTTNNTSVDANNKQQQSNNNNNTASGETLNVNTNTTEGGGGDTRHSSCSPLTPSSTTPNAAAASPAKGT